MTGKPTAQQLLMFPAIDLLRGFAAVSVVVYHVIEHMGWTTFPVTGPLLWFRIGWMGVDLFFVISGFVIALSAFGLLDRLGTDGFRMPFVRRRITRILPLHYLTCLVFILVIGISHNGIYSNLISHMGFFHNLNWRWSGAINGPNWSVAVEMQFYLLILLISPILRNCKWWLIPLVAFPMAWAWRYGAFTLVPIDPETGPFFRFWASTQLPGTLDQFAIGVLLARLVRAEQMQRHLSVLRRQSWLVVLVAVAAVWLALTLFWPRASFWDHAGMVVFWRSLISIAFGTVVFAACCITNPMLLRATAPLRYLGTISYGIYLWHLTVLLMVKQFDTMSPALALTIVLSVTILLSAASWHLFERRFLLR